MLRSRVQYLFIILLIIFPIACDSSGPSDPAAITLTENDNGSTVELGVGEMLETILESNPTTGYGWETDVIDTTLLQLEKQEFIPDNPDPEIVGSGGKEIMTFTTLAVGQTTLRLIYHRTWEEKVPPLKTFEVIIIIE